MNPILPDPEPLGIPVPVPLLLVLKVFGFWLHLVFMSLWLAGMPAALVLWRRHPAVARRLFGSMPFFLAFGINAGIVPLLFIQTLYPRFFYTATILQAWFWFLVIPLVLLAYMAAYFAASGRFRFGSALVASVLFLWIGYTFSAAMHTLSSPRVWPEVFLSTAQAGAVSGLYLRLDVVPLVRLGLILGMALGSVAAYLGLDLNVIRPDRAQARATRYWIPFLYGAGVVLYSWAGWLYLPVIADRISAGARAVTAGSLVLALFAAVLYAWRPGRLWSTVLAVLHAFVLLANAIDRQTVQTRALAEWLEPDAFRVQGAWGSLAMFVVVLLAGLAVLVWMVRLYWRYRLGPE